MYRIFKQTGSGEFIHVTTREDLEKAAKVVDAFNFQWPGRYVVQDLDGDLVYETEPGPTRPGRSRLSAAMTHTSA